MYTDVFHRFSVLAVFVFFFGFSTSEGFAKSKHSIREGVVLKKESSSRFLSDLGLRDGAFEGMKLTIFRRIRLRHPITKKWINDRLQISLAKIIKVSTHLSLVELQGVSSYPLTVGDFLVPTGRLKPAPQKVKTVIVVKKVPVECDGCELDRPSVLLRDLWINLKGRTLAERLQAWLSFLKKNKKHPHKAHIRSHIRWLHQLEKKMSTESVEEPKWYIRHNQPRRVELGERVSIVVTVVAAKSLASIVCFYRKSGEHLYFSLKMKKLQKHYYQVDLPFSLVQEKGFFEYFVELVDVDGGRYSGGGTSKEPNKVSVFAPSLKKVEKTGRSAASTSFEYVDFFSSSLGKDSYFRFEGDYRYLLNFHYLRAVRMGFGIFEGQGVDAEALAKDPSIDSTPQAYSYGYLETEWAFHPYFAVMGRLIMGSVRLNVALNKESSGLFGFEGRVRIGRLLGTNLQLAGMLTSDIGGEGEITVTMMELPKFPMGASVIVTNLPLGTNLGIRLLYQVGWRPVPWFSLDARVGWNVRNINHSGPTAGLGMTFRW